MHHRLSRLALCAAAALFVQPALAGDPTPRLCDPTDRVDPTDGMDQIEIGSVCPAGAECYVGYYPADPGPPLDAGYCWMQGAPPIDLDVSENWVAVVFLAKDPPTSRLACTNVSACEVACEGYPVGNDTSHAWSASEITPEFLSAKPLTIEAHENTALVTIATANPVALHMRVTSPFGISHSSFHVQGGVEACDVEQSRLRTQSGSK